MEIRASESLIERLRDHLAAAAPEEEGAFAVIGLVRHDHGLALTVRELILPQRGDWLDRGEHWLTPKTAYINRAVMRADALAGGLAFIHSHPDPGHPATLSGIDQISTKKLFANLQTLLGKAPLASLVFTPEGFAGVIQAAGRLHKATSLTTLGGRLKKLPASDATEAGSRTRTPRLAAWDRQVRAIGSDAQRHLMGLRIAVIGAGGTGSPVAEMLCRLGVQDLTIVDDDLLEDTNVSRVYGSTPADVGSKKVDVVAEHCKRIAPRAKITALAANVLDSELRPTLSSMDLVFCCTDTDSSRALVNELATTCYVPVLDLGCKLDVSEGHVRAVLGRVRLLGPDLPCLWCTRTIDGVKIVHESMSQEERERLAASGYGSLLGPAPMVVHLTTTVAGIAINEFLRLVADVGEPHAGDYVLLDLATPKLERVTARRVTGCWCSTRMGMGN